MEEARKLSTLLDLCIVFKITDKSCQISLCGVWTNTRRRIVMLEGLGNANKEFTYVILGSTIKEG